MDRQDEQEKQGVGDSILKVVKEFIDYFEEVDDKVEGEKTL